MRSSVAEPYSSQGVRGSNVQYVPQSRQNMPPVQPLGRSPVQSAQQSKRRLVLAPTEGWLAMGLLAVAVYCVVYSIIAADYESSTFILPWSAFIGLFVGLGVAKIRKMPQGVLHLAACLLGHWLAVYLTSFVALHISWIVLLSNIRSNDCGWGHFIHTEQCRYGFSLLPDLPLFFSGLFWRVAYLSCSSALARRVCLLLNYAGQPQ